MYFNEFLLTQILTDIQARKKALEIKFKTYWRKEKYDFEYYILQDVTLDELYKKADRKGQEMLTGEKLSTGN